MQGMKHDECEHKTAGLPGMPGKGSDYNRCDSDTSFAFEFVERNKCQRCRGHVSRAEYLTYQLLMDGERFSGGHGSQNEGGEQYSRLRDAIASAAAAKQSRAWNTRIAA